MESPSDTEQMNSSSKGKVINQRVVSILGFLLFVVFSSVQENDASEYGTAAWLTNTWLIGYALISLLCLFNTFRPLPFRNFLYLAGITFILSMYRGSQINWDTPLFFSEGDPSGNEAGGLMIISLWSLLLWWANRRLLKSKQTT